MTTTAEAVQPTRQAAPATAQRLILPGVSWTTYEQLLADFADSHAAHFAYDRGVLEIMVLSFAHETYNRTLAAIVEVLAEELAIDLVNAGSTTFKRADLERGFEPDTGFYLQHAGHIQGKRELDLSVDPPPDLIIEIDLTSPSLDKLPLYAAIGVPEVWRYDGKTLTILRLTVGQYQKQANSTALADVAGQIIQQFIDTSRTLTRNLWLRNLREWARRYGAERAASP